MCTHDVRPWYSIQLAPGDGPILRMWMCYLGRRPCVVRGVGKVRRYGKREISDPEVSPKHANVYWQTSQSANSSEAPIYLEEDVAHKAHSNRFTACLDYHAVPNSHAYPMKDLVGTEYHILTSVPMLLSRCCQGIIHR